MTAAAGNGYALADGEWGVTLFLNHHDGVTVIFTDFQLNALRFVHRALYALTGYATGNRACSGCKRTTSTAADGITKEATDEEVIAAAKAANADTSSAPCPAATRWS